MRRTMLPALAITPAPAVASCSGGPPPTAPTSPATEAATTRILAQRSGTAPATFQAFTATGQWTLAYSFDCRNQPSIEFRVTDSDGTELITNIAQQQGGGQGPGLAGAHQLTVTSHCPWSITITE